MNATDNQQIVSEVYEVFAKMNARAARNANYDEGLAENQAYGGRSDGWGYYNSDYYYQCEEAKGLLRQAAGYVTGQWEIPAVDFEEIEQNTIFTLDGKLDFNSCWNWEYRNRVAEPAWKMNRWRLLKIASSFSKKFSRRTVLCGFL